MTSKFETLSDHVVAAALGRRLRALRLRKNRTQEVVAERTALSVRTIQSLEAGRGKLENLIAVLRDLGALEALEAFLPEPSESPMAAIARQPRARRRATGSRGKPQTAGAGKEPEAW